MTDAKVRAKEVIAGCPEVWNRICLIDQVTFEALEKRIAAALDAVRRETWEEAANDLSHGLPAIWKKVLIDRCLAKAQEDAMSEGLRKYWVDGTLWRAPAKDGSDTPVYLAADVEAVLIPFLKEVLMRNRTWTENEATRLLARLEGGG